MIDLQTYIISLLIIAGVGMYFIFRVIMQQLRLFKKKAQTVQIGRFRRVLFYLSIVIVIMGMIPVLINVYSLFFATDRPPVVPWISVVYSMTVHVQGLLLSYLLWRLYRLAASNDN